MRDDQPSPSAFLITAPTDDTRCYDLCVSIPMPYRPFQLPYRVQPWVKVTANCQTDDVFLSAGTRLMYRDRPDDDGA